jgi:CMP-N,N'-diacetyllegionaminic acid synthase
MKYLVVIPARGGSKRLLRKNILELNGKSMIQWTIDFAKSIDWVTDIIVSTDSEEIVKTIETQGLLVPWLRPNALATDQASTAEVCLHALEWYERNIGLVDAVITLQPTSPFRTLETFEKAKNLFEANEPESVVSILRKEIKIESLLSEDSKLISIFELKEFTLNSKFSNIKLFYPSGNLYFTRVGNLKIHNSLFSNFTIPLKSNSGFEDIDIDDEKDFALAKILASNFSSNR